MKSTLVTVFGGSGFLGRNVVRALAKQGYRIRVAVRHPRLANYLIPAGVVGQIQLVKADVVETDDIAAALAGAQAVINLTGILYSGGGQNFADVHADAAGHIAEAAKAAGIKTLVHVSALGADAHSDSSYAQSKAEGEKRVREAFPDAAILRPSILFGADDSFFNKFASLARYVPFLPLIGGGRTKFQPVFVGDAAAAVLRCLDDASTRGKTYELGGPNVYSFKELMQIVLRTTDRKRLLLPVPFAIAYAKALFLGLLPSPILTMDQVTLLKSDNVVTSGAPGLAELGITAPTSVEAEVPSYLWRFKPKGQYEDSVLEGATLQR